MGTSRKTGLEVEGGAEKKEGRRGGWKEEKTQGSKPWTKLDQKVITSDWGQGVGIPGGRRAAMSATWLHWSVSRDSSYNTQTTSQNSPALTLIYLSHQNTHLKGCWGSQGGWGRTREREIRLNSTVQVSWSEGGKWSKSNCGGKEKDERWREKEGRGQVWMTRWLGWCKLPRTAPRGVANY